jgi:hypothetical protein
VATKKWTPAADTLADKKAGVKDGSKKDAALDKKRGVPEPKFPAAKVKKK